MSSLNFAGIGSRATPTQVCTHMQELAHLLCINDKWTLRSGGADGADSAFEKGCDGVDGKKEIYLPWKQFNSNQSDLYVVDSDSLQLAAQYHPHWTSLKPFAKSLMARNGYQVLGSTLNDPVSFVICWTRDGVERGADTTRHTGGTGQAIRIASDYHIPVFNLAKPNRYEELLDFIGREQHSLLEY